MKSYLDFKPAKCRDCYKCLRSCPVKAITMQGHQAKIIDDRCILCGTCTNICPQNAKFVHSEIDDVKALLSSGKRIIASVAPSFVSSFGTDDFSVMKIALGKLGFADAQETAIGAQRVTAEYKKLLEGGTYKNFITSACPAINRMIELYYPAALPYLAKVDSPMIAHAKLIRDEQPDAKIVFIGPCIAKKREADESGIVDAVLTFEDLQNMFAEAGIDLNEITRLPSNGNQPRNRAKVYPVSRGIIKSFDELPEGYEYIAADGIKRCADILEHIDEVSGLFLELNVCEYACVKGPCSLIDPELAIKATSDVRNYASRDMADNGAPALKTKNIDVTTSFKRLPSSGNVISERVIKEILAKTGKVKPEDELNCGACGYATCREKAWAVANGFADVEMCLPYMRDRAETMSYEILQNSPYGIIAIDSDLRIVDINQNARIIIGIPNDGRNIKGENLVDYLDPTDFIIAEQSGHRVTSQKITIPKTHKIIDLTITVLKEHRVMFGIFKDITAQADFEAKLNKVRMDTIATTDEVIKKQMRVAQEIAGLLGETTAETKVALLQLKKALTENPEGENK